MSSDGFHQSSKNIRLDGTILIADCTRHDGSSNPTSIDLNNYIKNDDGELIWTHDGNFVETCQCISLFFGPIYGEPNLCCFALRMDGTFNPTALDLSSKIINENGNLICKP